MILFLFSKWFNLKIYFIAFNNDKYFCGKFIKAYLHYYTRRTIKHENHRMCFIQTCNTYLYG